MLAGCGTASPLSPPAARSRVSTGTCASAITEAVMALSSPTAGRPAVSADIFGGMAESIA